MTAQTPAERKRKERQARRDAGLVRVEVWTTPELAAMMLTIARQPTEDEAIACLRRWLMYLTDQS